MYRTRIMTSGGPVERLRKQGFHAGPEFHDKPDPCGEEYIIERYGHKLLLANAIRLGVATRIPRDDEKRQRLAQSFCGVLTACGFVVVGTKNSRGYHLADETL